MNKKIWLGIIYFFPIIFLIGSLDYWIISGLEFFGFFLILTISFILHKFVVNKLIKK